MKNFEFKSTNEAFVFGRRMGIEFAEQLRLQRIEHMARSDVFLRQGELDEAVIEATNAQFCQEAIWAWENRRTNWCP